MNNNFPAFIVHYKKADGSDDHAIFLKFLRAEEFAAKYHGYIGGLVEVSLEPDLKKVTISKEI